MEHGKLDGQGTITLYGDKYVGQFKDGKQHGQGTKTFDYGDEYVGEWKDNNALDKELISKLMEINT